MCDISGGDRYTLTDIKFGGIRTHYVIVVMVMTL